MSGPLRLNLKPAPRWAAAVALAHLIAAAAAWIALPWQAAVVAAAGLALSAYLAASAALLRGPLAVRALELKADGSVGWLDRDGEWRAGTLASWGTLGVFLTALVLATQLGKRAVVLVPGMAEPDALRRVRIWLRWRTQPKLGSVP